MRALHTTLAVGPHNLTDDSNRVRNMIFECCRMRFSQMRVKPTPVQQADWLMASEPRPPPPTGRDKLVLHRSMPFQRTIIHSITVQFKKLSDQNRGVHGYVPGNSELCVIGFPTQRERRT